MKRSYLAAVCEGGGTYGIVFRDFPGCISAGDSLNEVLAMGQEALQGHIEVAVNHGELVPEPSVHVIADVQDWLDDPADPVEERWIGLFPIEVDVPAYPETIPIPVRSEIVREIAELVQKNVDPLSSRQFIEDLARRELDRLKKSA
jgi:predicted RNase H-like HicB family nuclease